MSISKTHREKRAMRHRKIRKQISGSAERPRLAVFRSNRYVYAQVIDDTAGRTLVAANDRESEARGKRARAEATGALVAERALAAGVKAVLFDRGGFNYAGRVAALATAARKAGLVF